MVENLISDVAKTRLRVFALATEDVSACGWLLDLLGARLASEPNATSSAVTRKFVGKLINF
jgi:hypothetical protein